MTRVYVDVVGDLFHIGHINMFKKARSLFKEPYLIVGVHADKDVASYKRSPIISESDRYEIIRNCKLVDEVIESSPLYITKKFIIENDIHYVVHGDDISEELKRQHKVPSDLGIVRYVPYTSGVSTTEIINKIKNTKSTSKLKS